MATAPGIKLPITVDASGVVQAARIIARHLTALADELEAPETIIAFHSELTPQQAAEFRERLTAHFDGAQEGACDSHPAGL